MPPTRPLQPRPHRAHPGLLCALAFGVLGAVWLYCGSGYGFHQDELQFLDDARHLRWEHGLGFVAYPPLTSALGRLAIALFGISPAAFRVPAVVLNATSLVVTGLLARELGGGRAAQVFTLLANLPVALAFSSVLQYNTPDYLAWTLLAFSTARVLQTGDERNWMGAGAALGLGALSKYSIAFAAISLVLALLLLPSQRHHLRSRWFWLGALLTLVLASPNLLWLATHHFLTLQMEHHIHLRDVRLGRADGYFTDQIKYTLFALPLALAGLRWLVRSPRFRLLSAFWLGPFLLFALARGRGYYLLPAYPVLYAAGAVALQQALHLRPRATRLALTAGAASLLLLDSVGISIFFLPLFPPGSPLFTWQMRHNDDMPRLVGWPEFVAQVAAVRDTLPAAERARLAIVGKNYGDTASVALYGPRYGLPTPISTVNSFWARGWAPAGDPSDPDTFIILGGSTPDEHSFASCVVAAQVHPPFGIRNEATQYHPDILVCRHLLHPLPDLWRDAQTFG